MLLLILILGIITLVTGWIGYRKTFHLGMLSRGRVINGFLALMVILTLMTIAHWMRVFTQEFAATTTMGVYMSAAGFFMGYGGRLMGLKKKAGDIQYRYRSFWSDLAPALVSILLVAFGIYRTGILSLGPFTGIGITSGLSLIGFGFWGWTLSIVPEFREKGLLMLDRYHPWERIIAYEWISEESVEIDYITATKGVSSFSTYIPADDKTTAERILATSIQEYSDERQQLLEENG